MEFLLSRKTVFTASINFNKATYLDGVTKPILEFTNISSTIPLDLNLWHHQFAHHNYVDVKKMIREGIGRGMHQRWQHALECIGRASRWMELMDLMEPVVNTQCRSG
jgi:hypothetical protein